MKKDEAEKLRYKLNGIYVSYDVQTVNYGYGKWGVEIT